MRAGQLRHEIQVQYPVIVQGPSGEEVVTWGAFGTLRAEITPLNGREALVANQPLSELDTVMLIRWSPNNDQITTKWRIIHDRIIYDIKNVAHVKLAQRMIELRCKSGANSG